MSSVQLGDKEKLRFVKKFIEDLTRINSSPPIITWLQGSSPQELISSITEFAVFLNIPTTDHTNRPIPLYLLMEQIASKVISKVTNSGWLIVLDNVDQEYEDCATVVKILLQNDGFVVLTSRKNDIYAGEVYQLSLPTLLPADSLKLVNNSLENVIETDVTLLCEELGHHALALQQSVAYIRENRQKSVIGNDYNIPNFLEELKDNRKIILQHALKLADYDQTILTIVQLSLSSISNNYGDVGSLVKTVAVILGVVRPDGIHLHILQNLVDIYLRNKPGPPRSKMLRLFSCQLFCKTEDGAVPTLTQATPPRTRKVVQLLTKFSLVNVESEVISIHRLVQDIFRLECDYKDALSILLKHVKIKGLSREELVQLISIWEHADEEIVKQNSNLVFQIFDKMFWSTPDLMMHEKEGFLNKNYALLRQVCGPDHAETIKMEVFVSLVSNHDCDPAETLTKYTQLFDKIQMVFGSRHPLTNLTICCIAQTLLSLGRPEEALEWCRKRLAQDHLLCVQEEHKMHTMSIMAQALVHLTRFDEAIIIYQEILEWRIKNLGPSHEHTLATLNHLTIFPYVAGRITEEDAITEFENQLGQMVDKLGPEHRITLNTKYTLAGALWDMGDTDKAFVMLEEVLLSMEKAFGPNHRDTVLVRKGISERKIMMEEGTTRKCLYPGVKW